jgi:signal transduction histidine kinase
MDSPAATAARLARTLLRPLSGRPTGGDVAKDVLLWTALSWPPAAEALLRGPASASAVGTVAAVLVLAAAVLLSRPYPVAAAVIGLAAVPLIPLTAAGAAVLCFLAGRRDPRVGPAAAAAAAITAAALAAAVLGGAVAVIPALLTSGVIGCVLPWMVGVHLRQRDDLAYAGWERARRLETEQRITADRVRLRERSRIARDMHDSLGHELGLIALRAGALELAPDLGERHRAAAAGVRESATEATERLREIIGVLRDPGGPAPLEPVGEDVTGLVARARASGMDVALERAGEGAGPGPMADRAAYRVVQEALTNAARHAPGAAVRVLLRRDAAGTAVEVRNSAPPAGAPDRPAAGGHGLVGLAERVRLAGGTLEAGPREGGFAVAARFPAGASPAAAASGYAAGDGPDTAAPGPRAGADDPVRRARRRLRTGAAKMAATAVLLLAAAVGTGAAASFYRMSASTLDPWTFNALRVGDSEAEVAEVLPRMESPVVPEGLPPAPPGADCRHYRSEVSLAGGGATTYRLCFAGGELVSADARSWEAGT